MSDQYTYARFWRCALQVNPVGYNGTYRGADHGLDEGGYNQALLQKCLELGIKVVGLADHGSVASVDALRQVLQPHGIVVFPGFEIASNDKTHYVCLFSEETRGQLTKRKKSYAKGAQCQVEAIDPAPAPSWNERPEKALI